MWDRGHLLPGDSQAPSEINFLTPYKGPSEGEAAFPGCSEPWPRARPLPAALPRQGGTLRAALGCSS